MASRGAPHLSGLCPDDDSYQYIGKPQISSGVWLCLHPSDSIDLEHSIKLDMIIPTKLAMNHASSGTATTTFEGRTEVDVVKLLKRPNVQKIIQQIANNTP